MSEREDVLDAAFVLAPEAPLGESLSILFAVQNGFGDALGALAPPEVAITWVWPDRIRVNGADCGVFRVDASTRDLTATPNWLIAGVTLQMASPLSIEPGHSPSTTALIEEGVGDLTRTRLLESWSRHCLVWINSWLEDGFRPVHDAWIGRVEEKDAVVSLTHGGASRRGVFLGLDDRGGLLLKSGDDVAALGLEAMLDHPRRWEPDGDGNTP